MSVKISAQMTGETRELNGLNSIEADLINEPREKRYAIVEFHALRTTTEHDDGDVHLPTVKFDHIEPLTGKDADTAHALLQKAYLARQKSEADAAGQADLFSDPE